MEEAISWYGAGVMVNVVHSSSGEDTNECLWGTYWTISAKSCTHGIGNISWNRQDSIIWNTQAQIISAIYESMFLCLLELPWQYILWEVFLYSDCDIYDTQTTTNPIRYIAPILLFVSKNWRPSWILHFEAWGASKLQFTHKNWLSTLRICKMHVSHKLIPQLICLAMVHSLQMAAILNLVFWRPQCIQNVKYTS